MRLKDKTVLITGAARGIGKCFAAAYIAEGATVVIADREGAVAAASDLGEQAIVRELDVRDLAAIEATVAWADEQCAGIDILVNNAAIYDMAPITDITLESYDKLMEVNVRGPLFLMREVANKMIARGRGGKIINMASQAGRRGEALSPLYCLSKAAIISATQSAGLALIKHGINVNAISPGVVEGPLWDEVDAHFAKWEGLELGAKKVAVGKEVPLGRMGTPADLAPMAVFLASSASDYVVGQTYNVDGGNVLS